MIKKIKNFIQFKSDYEFLMQENDRLKHEILQLNQLFNITKWREENKTYELYENEYRKNEKLQKELNEYKQNEKFKEQNYTHKVVFKGQCYNTRYVTEKQFNEIKQVLTTVKDDELYVDVAGELFKIKDIEIVTTLENKGGQNEI